MHLYYYTQFKAFPGQRNKNLLLLTTYFSFDEVSQNSEVKLKSAFFFNVKVILVEANRTRSLI